jgi:hypothetical protein
MVANAKKKKKVKNYGPLENDTLILTTISMTRIFQLTGPHLDRNEAT